MMYKYFKNVTSFDDLKSQFKKLAKANHPDAGGDSEVMKAINAEYDALFVVWKSKSHVNTEETAESTRSEFYTQNGWKGDNYDSRRDLKDVASIVREHLKKTYPEWKFSVRMSRAYNKLYVTLMESPVSIYSNKAYKPNWDEKFFGSSYYTREKYTDDARKLFDDVISFVNSYNYEDIDGMIDYFSVGFWFNGVDISADYKVVEPKAKKTAKKTTKAKTVKLGDEYDIKKSVHTKTGEVIWVVKFNRTLERAEYIKEAQKMQGLGGYYSRFVHGFVFKADPTEKLVA